jgi:DNA mismatch repair protein MutS
VLAPPGQGDLFGSTPHPAVDYLEHLNPDEITAKEALAILYELKNKTAR